MQRLEQLNSSQRQAVTDNGRHLCIVAGPGTGKTHTLTHRIWYQLLSLPPEQGILALTFTHKAAEEMRDRLASFPDSAGLGRITVGTFHHFCLGVLRRYGRRIGLPEAFRIILPDEMMDVLKSIWPRLSLRDLKKRKDDISTLKNRESLEMQPGFLSVYQEALRACGRLDFDDLLMETIRLWKADPAVLRDYQRHFPRICVDEYQDINALQYHFLKCLIGPENLLTVIGDPQQAIYGFRGGDVNLFHRVALDFPGVEVMRLTDNYRCAPNLLTACGQVIRKGAGMAVAELTARIYREGRLIVHDLATDRAEAEYVVHQMERLIGGTSFFSHDSGRVAADSPGGYGFGDMAVLYRLNSQRLVLQEALDRSGIPYQVSGNQPLIAQPLMGRLHRFLRAAVLGGRDDDSGDDDLIQPVDGAAVKDRISKEGFLKALPGLEDLSFLRRMIRQEKTFLVNWQRLIRYSRLFSDPLDFFDYWELQREIDGGGRCEAVSLMTLHAAKGLEFPVVFIVGCEQQLIPLEISGMTSDLQEERRLFYVGMTRAKERLYLLRARKRRLYGRVSMPQPSVFLTDIEEALKVYEQQMSPVRRRKTEEQMQLFG
jgi:DNA helicase-2/ATP-dependent DNA helicase PcrA